MTKPPSRGGADSIRYRSSSAKPEAKMQVVDVDEADSTVKREGWFAYIMPTQTGVEMVGSGRYGWWEERPKVTHTSGSLRVEGGANEPILVAPSANVITVYVAQAQHVESKPLPQLKEPEQS